MAQSCFENKRYKMMKVKEGVYVPDVENTFPEDNPFYHCLKYDFIYDHVFDENYPYIDNSFKARFSRFFGRIRAFGVCFWVNPLIFGLRIKNREVLKKHREALKNGAVTVANHAYRWDFLAVWQASGQSNLWFPGWGENFNTYERDNMRAACGIPVPTSMSGLKKFNEAFDSLHEQKKWIHVFPEECRWDFYKPIRPFRKGAFTFSYKYKIPIVPMVITYRERTGFYKLFNKNMPLFTITVGEPIFPNLDLPRKDSVDELRDRVHAKMVEMAGITENPWPSVLPNDNG